MDGIRKEELCKTRERLRKDSGRRSVRRTVKGYGRAEEGVVERDW
jgi:hypothetical protein